MKRFFFFCLCFFLPSIVMANSIQNVEVKNGELSRKFEPDNNVYSIFLHPSESHAILDYQLADERSSCKVLEDQDKIVLQVESIDGQQETYTFYYEEKQESTPVFQEIKGVEPVQTKLHHLEFYVGFACFLIILCLFKLIVIGFRKK